jgi:cyclopropane-fatty-acyl-phospholipid synthase
MGTTTTVAATISPVVQALLGSDDAISLQFWDGSRLGPEQAAATLVMHSPQALRRLLFEPNELGFGRAYVMGEIDIEGDVYSALNMRDLLAGRDEGVTLQLGVQGIAKAWKAAWSLGIIGLPPAPPPEEARLKGRRHSRQRDASAIAHHYDVSNDFYRIVLGPTMTYSCAFFYEDGLGLDDAQIAKYDLICRKLALSPGDRLLDVGCGWGGMVMHAARNYGARAVGVTISRAQAELAAKRVEKEGLSDQVEIRVQDYREIDDEPFDAVSSIGMFEHVGLAHLAEYFQQLRRLVQSEGRIMNHGISRPAGKATHQPKSFIERYVFPDGELHEVGTVVSVMQAQRIEVRDVECLREHYAQTLRNWVANLEANWDRAVSIAGPNRARVWRLYMAGAALGFEAGRTSIHQVMGVRMSEVGASGMPRNRSSFVLPASAHGAAAVDAHDLTVDVTGVVRQ